MSLLTELDLFCDRNLQRCQPYGLEKSVFIGIHRWLNSFAPIVHPKMNTGKEPFKCDIRIAEWLNNKATKQQSYVVLVAWFLGCSKEFPSACVRFPSSPSLVRPVVPAQCGFGVREHVRALVRRDMSRRGKAMSCHRTPKKAASVSEGRIVLIIRRMFYVVAVLFLAAALAALMAAFCSAVACAVASTSKPQSPSLCSLPLFRAASTSRAAVT